MDFGIGTPLTGFILATCCICLGMTLGVLACCVYIKYTANRSFSDAYVLTDINAGGPVCPIAPHPSTASLSSRPACSVAPNPSTSSFNASATYNDGQSDHTASPLKTPSSKSECCTIYVPDVGIIL